MKGTPTSSEILELLQGSGLTEKEAEVYKFLVETGGATTKDLMRKLRFRQPQIYDITASLERKHFLNVLESRPKRFIPESMDIILDRRLRDFKYSSESLLKWSASSNGAETTQPAMWISRNWENFVNSTARVILKSKGSICVEAPPAVLDDFRPVLYEKQKENVDCVLLVYGISRSHYESEYLKYDRRMFSEIRYVQPGQFFAAIGGGGGATFMPRAVSFRPPAERYGYVFKDSDVAWFLTHSFFSGWFKSETLYRRQVELPKTYNLQRLAVSDMITIQKENEKKRIFATIGGLSKKGNRNVEISGVVERVVANEDIVNFTLESDGERLVVGGYDSIVEDIQADWVRIDRCV